MLWHPGSFFTRRWDTIVEALDYLLEQHPEFAPTAADSPASRASRRSPWRRSGAGARRGASSATTLRHHPLERRALVTVPVLLRLVSADRSCTWRTGRARHLTAARPVSGSRRRWRNPDVSRLDDRWSRSGISVRHASSMRSVTVPVVEAHRVAGDQVPCAQRRPRPYAGARDRCSGASTPAKTRTGARPPAGRRRSPRSAPWSSACRARRRAREQDLEGGPPQRRPGRAEPVHLRGAVHHLGPRHGLAEGVGDATRVAHHLDAAQVDPGVPQQPGIGGHLAGVDQQPGRRHLLDTADSAPTMRARRSRRSRQPGRGASSSARAGAGCGRRACRSADDLGGVELVPAAEGDLAHRVPRTGRPERLARSCTARRRGAPRSHRCTGLAEGGDTRARRRARARSASTHCVPGR